MEVYGGAEMHLHAFQTWPLYSRRKSPRYRSVGLTAGLEAVTEKEFPCPRRTLNRVVWCLYWLSYSDSCSSM